MGGAENEESAVRALQDFALRVGSVQSPLTGRLDAAAGALFPAFQEAGVAALLLKGPGLARLLYTPQEHRAYTDLDLLVEPRDWRRAGEVLAALGFRNASADLGIDDVGGVVHDQSWVGVRDGGHEGLLVELHQWLPGSRAAPEQAWPALVADSTTIDVGGHPVRTLNRSGQAMHLALHAAQHGPGFAKGLWELELALDRWPLAAWSEAAALAADIDAGDAFAVGLRLVPDGEALATSLGLRPSARLEWEIENRHLRPRGAFHFEALVEASGIRGRLALLRRALLPDAGWILAQHPWARVGRGRLPAAYVVHLMRAPIWTLRSLTYSRRARQARRSTHR